MISAVDAVIERTIRPRAQRVDADSDVPAEALAALADEGLGVLLMPRDAGRCRDEQRDLRGGPGAHRRGLRLDLDGVHDADALRPPDPSAGARREQVETWIPSPLRRVGCRRDRADRARRGLDVGAMRTLARRDGDEYVINGEKTFISNGDHADVIVLFASVDLASGKDGVTAFLLETGDLDGFEVGTPMKKLGQKGASTVTLALQDCRIPASARMGEEGEGYPLLLRSVVRSRISAAAQGARVRAGRLRRRRRVGRRA